MASRTSKDRHLKEIVEKSQYWDVEDLISNFDREMAQLEQGLSHMIWDAQCHCVTPHLRPLPLTPRFEVSENDDELKAKIRLPNVSREDMRLDVYANSVSILACAGDVVCRPYYLRIDSDSELVPDSADATFEGEELEIRVKKVKKKRLKIR